VVIRQPKRARLTGGAAALAILLAVVVLAAPSGANAASFQSNQFSYGNSNCTDHVDPITIVFYGYTAFYRQSRNIVQIFTGWSGKDGTSQYASSHGVCTHMDGESYSGCGICNRYHIRYNQTHTLDSLGRYETVGTPHEDRVSWHCGIVPKHVARNYNGVRNLIHNKIAQHGYKYYWQYWGNTEPQKQCDGSKVSSDGWVVWQRVDN
jgi:hypothetical protein